MTNQKFACVRPHNIPYVLRYVY